MQSRFLASFYADTRGRSKTIACFLHPEGKTLVSFLLGQVAVKTRKMRRFGKILACLLLALCPVSPLSAGAEKPSSGMVWKIEQRHRSSGDLTLYLKPDAVKIHKKNFGYFVLSKAPDWNVYVFRDDDRVICKLTTRAFLTEQGFLAKAPPIESYPKIGDGFIGTVKTSIYRLDSHDDSLAKFPGVSQEIYNLINATTFYQSEPANGVILKSTKNHVRNVRKKTRILSLDSENLSGMRIETFKISKIQYKSSDFAVPANYRPVKLRVALSSIENRREADSIMEQMGLGEKLGK